MSEQDKDLDKVIQKVQKLLAMAEDTSSPNEALLAANRARKLMDKHQLSKDDIERATGDQFLETTADRKTKTCQTWLRFLVQASAYLNDCRPVLGWDGLKLYKFQGFKADAIVAKLTMDYLVDACERALEKSNSHGRSEKNFFRIGFSEMVLRRAIAVKKEREKSFVSASTGTALVPVKEAMILSHFGVMGKARKTQVREPSVDEAQAYANGLRTGRHVGLEKQVEGQETTKLAANC